jgi:hypothetical protein
MLKWIKSWWDMEGTLTGLQRLDDRLLADMGLERESLRARVQGSDRVSTVRCEDGAQLASVSRC